MGFSSSWSGSCSILWTAPALAFLQTSQKLFVLLHFFPCARHHLGQWLNAEYLQFCFTGILTGYVIFFHLLLFLSYILYLVKFFHLTQTVNAC